MSVAYQKGQTLGSDDLKITIRDTSGNLVDPAAITYSIFDFTTGVEVLIGTPNVVPESSGVGLFHVGTTIPLDANVGDWIVRWNFKETSTSSITQAVQEFNVVEDTVRTTSVGSGIATSLDSLLIRRLRIMLRDNNPDRNYRFRPPSTEQFIQTQTEVFGYIWEDEELYEYILISIDMYNAAPPVTDISILDMPNRWRSVVMMGACAQACRSIAMNWIADEFSVAGEEEVTIKLGDGELVTLPIEELYDILHGGEERKMLEESKAASKTFKEEEDLL